MSLARETGGGVMEALFDLPTKTTTRPKRILNPYPRVSREPQWRPCPTCKTWVLLAMADDGLWETSVDPISLTPTAVQACHMLNRPVYRAPMTQGGRPTELWSVMPRDPALPDPWAYYWLAEHACHAPPLPGSPLAIKRPQPTPTQPPY